MMHALASGALVVKLCPAMGDVQLARRYFKEVKRAGGVSGCGGSVGGGMN